MTNTEKVIKFLIENKFTIATAESCTAGLIAAAIGDFSGVSEIFSEGYVTYSNEAKEKNLGVSHETLESYGAVSFQTALEMAKGVCERTNARIGISATGIAGPTGATSKKPVGLVYIGICVDGKTTYKKCNFSGDRQEVRKQTVDAAFYELGKILKIFS